VVGDYMAVYDAGTERYDTGSYGTTRAGYAAIVAERWYVSQRRVGHVNQDGRPNPPRCTATSVGVIA